MVFEAALQHAFRRHGRLVSSKGGCVAICTVILFLVLGFGILNVQTETDLYDLWVDTHSRIGDELDFFEDNFKSQRYQSLIVEPKVKGPLTEGLLNEIKQLSESFIKTKYTHPGLDREISYENLCYKVLDKKEDNACFQLNILDCFKEGDAIIVGGENNTIGSGAYAERPSYQGFDYNTFTKAYADEQCMYWFRLDFPYRMFLGSPVWNPAPSGGSESLKSFNSLRLTYAVQDVKDLKTTGLTVSSESFNNDELLMISSNLPSSPSFHSNLWSLLRANHLRTVRRLGPSSGGTFRGCPHLSSYSLL
jgi:hypothetical protein